MIEGDGLAGDLNGTQLYVSYSDGPLRGRYQFPALAGLFFDICIEIRVKKYNSSLEDNCAHARPI